MNKKLFQWMRIGLAGPLIFLADIVKPEDRTPLEVQVEVTEVDHAKTLSLGVQWFEKIGLLETVPAGGFKIGPVTHDPPLRADLHMLVQEGAAEILANPNLLTDSGTVATFHAGGEIPYITNASLGTTHVEFKPYGVELKIEPVLLNSGLIQMKIQAGISAPDQASTVSLSGNVVPGLFERGVSSNITLNPGATVTLAGLVQTTKDETVAGIPLLRAIPVLGALFRWRKVNHRKTSIIIFVTPKVAEL